MNPAELFTTIGVVLLGKIILIDLMLAADNVVILATLATQLPRPVRNQAIRIGVFISLIMLIGLSFVALQLLHIIGVLLVGGLLLVWVAWKLFRELTSADDTQQADIALTTPSGSITHMIGRIVIADLSMSMENVLAVAGVARDHPFIMFVGLTISVAVMGFAAGYVAKLIERFRPLAYAGVVMILVVAIGMIMQGYNEVHDAVRPFMT